MIETFSALASSSQASSETFEFEFRKLLLLGVRLAGLDVVVPPLMDEPLARPFAVTVLELEPRERGERGGLGGIVEDLEIIGFEGEGFLSPDDMIAYHLLLLIGRLQRRAEILLLLEADTQVSFTVRKYPLSQAKDLKINNISRVSEVSISHSTQPLSVPRRARASEQHEVCQIFVGSKGAGEAVNLLSCLSPYPYA